MPRLFRAPEWDPMFPADRMVPALEGTLADLGIDLRSQANVTLDLEERPNKSPRAFCAPIEVPDRVCSSSSRSAARTTGARSSTRAGTPSTSRTRRATSSMEEKRLGDNAVTEGWAMLLQHLTDEPEWLTRLLDFPRPHEYAVEGATGLLFFVRRYCAKILYEVEFHAAEDVTTMRDRYVELLGHALKIEPTAANYLADIDSGLLRLLLPALVGVRGAAAGVPEGEVRLEVVRHPRRRVAPGELWGEGQRMRAEEMLKEVTGYDPRDGGRRRPGPRGSHVAQSTTNGQYVRPAQPA